MTTLPTLPQLEVSELFRSLQGEGASLGAPCVFLRLASCNLSCRWCDTPYSWDWTRYDRSREVRRRALPELTRELEELLGEACQRLVVTGGEPLIQQKPLGALLDQLPGSLLVEVETNGTVTPTRQLLERVGQWNVSPKLSAAGDPVQKRMRPGALATLRDTGSAWLKLVVGQPEELAEVDALLSELPWPRERVLLMPEATNPERHGAVASWLAPAAIDRGLRFSPRLHVLLWGDRRGV